MEEILTNENPVLSIEIKYKNFISLSEFKESLKSLIDWLSTKIGKKPEIEHNEMIKSYTIVRPCNSMIQSI
ncbi:MAG: hypothetical protein Pg6A_13320 [Termitinemataceae bacterium]|nr:MAG: hypothetical protein Pg6A_13320 [Termitinemataceae bacterium]